MNSSLADECCQLRLINWKTIMYIGQGGSRVWEGKGFSRRFHAQCLKNFRLGNSAATWSAHRSLFGEICTCMSPVHVMQFNSQFYKKFLQYAIRSKNKYELMNKEGMTQFIGLNSTSERIKFPELNINFLQVDPSFCFPRSLMILQLNAASQRPEAH